MTVAIANVSSDGEIVMPASIKRGLPIKPTDKFLVFSENGMITLKRIEVAKKSFDEVAEPFRKNAEESGLKREDVEKTIHGYRAEKRKK